jgi:hypothetical protein
MFARHISPSGLPPRRWPPATNPPFFRAHTPDEPAFSADFDRGFDQELFRFEKDLHKVPDDAKALHAQAVGAIRVKQQGDASKDRHQIIQGGLR